MVDFTSGARGNALEQNRFLQLCLAGCLMAPDDALHANARAILAMLDGGADVPDALKSHLALFTFACTRLGVLSGAPSRARLTALALREDRRDALIREGRDVFLTLCRSVEVAPQEMRGPRLVGDAYPASGLRHTHALRFLLTDGAAPLGQALANDGWRAMPQSRAFWQGYRSPAGVELRLFSQVLPHVNPTLGHIGDPETQAALILCQRLFDDQQITMRWLVDLAFLLSRPMSADRVVAVIRDLGMARSGHAGLEMLRRILPDHAALAETISTIQMGLTDRHGTPLADSADTRRALRALRPSLVRRIRGRLARHLSRF